MKNKIIVSVENLSHKYSAEWAVKDVSFEICNTGILGLLGSNGAGKSTIMNIMCGVLNQTVGDVLINGENIRKNPVQAKQQIGFLPQLAPLYKDHTVDEYLIHCAYLRMMNPDDIPAALKRVKKETGITQFSDRLIRNLSGGFQQRTGIAGALIHNPKVVVLDEPTNGLDPVQIVEVRKIIKNIGKDRVVIFSTHILSEVKAICDDIKMIEDGKLVFSGTVDEFNDYIEPNSILVSMEDLPSMGELMEIEGISKVEMINDRKARLEFTTSQEVTELIIAASVKNNWRLREITVERSSLDDVFAKIAKDQNGN